MTTESNPTPVADTPTPIELAKRMVEQVWNGASRDDAHALMPHSFHWAEDPVIGPTRISSMGARSMAFEAEANRNAFPDFEIKVTDAFEDADGRAIVLFHASGTHTGEVRLGNNRVTDGKMLEGSGEKVQATGWFLVHTRDGDIASVVPSWNPRTLLQQAAGVDVDALV